MYTHIKFCVERNHIMKKFIVLMMGVVLCCSLMTGCGATKETVVEEVPQTEMEEAEEITVSPETEEVPTETEEVPAEEEVIAPEKVALGASDKDAEGLSGEFVFNANKLRVLDEDDNYDYRIGLEIIGDPGSVLDVICSYTTAQELYEEVKSTYVYEGSSWLVTEMRESTFLGLPAFYFEQKNQENASFLKEYFAVDLGNGLFFNNINAAGYSGNETLETMMSYAFLEMNPGDGTLYKPEAAYTLEDKDGILSVTFKNGETYTLDYDENAMGFWMENNSMSPYFIDSEFLETCVLQMYVTNKYASIAEYDKGQEAATNWESGLPVEEVNINGIDIQYITNTNRQIALFFIPMTEEYAIRGVYEYWPYKSGISAGPATEVALAKMFGGDAEVAAEQAKLKSRVDYGYQPPEALGDTMNKLFFELEGVLYTVPVPVTAMMDNGWVMVDETNSLEIIPQMQPGESRQIILEHANGGVIEDVFIDNPTDNIIPVEEALITEMKINNSGNVDLKFPGGIGFDSTQEEIIISTEDTVADNGDVLSYFWNGRGDGAWLSANVGKDDGEVKQFFFVGGQKCYKWKMPSFKK